MAYCDGSCREKSMRGPIVALFLIACLIAAAGCGTVDQAAQLDASGAGGAGGGVGPDAAGSPGSGAAGAAGGGSPAGGAPVGGQGGAIPPGGLGGAAGMEIDGGSSWSTCPKVGSLVIQLGDHCWVCEGETDAGLVGGAIAGPCEISAADDHGFGFSAPTFCAARASACP